MSRARSRSRGRAADSPEPESEPPQHTHPFDDVECWGSWPNKPLASNAPELQVPVTCNMLDGIPCWGRWQTLPPEYQEEVRRLAALERAKTADEQDASAKAAAVVAAVVE